MHRRRRARRAFHIRRFTWNTSSKTPTYELGTIRFVAFYFLFYHNRGLNQLLLAVCRGARHDEQEVRKSVYDLLPRHLAQRHAVPRKSDRAGHPRGGE